jgi:diguanylate cyclase (GGDEF)-like protein
MLRVVRPWLNILPATHSVRRALLDFAIIFGIGLVLWIVTSEMDLFESLSDYTNAHEEWQLDELIISFAIASLVFGLRRMQDQRRELALRLAAEQHATMLALQDALTGLPNRRRFMEALTTLVGQHSGCHAVIILDLDRFKPVNDVFGHASGDEALRTVAQRLKSLGDERILSARLGGDEFALIARNLTASTEAEKIAERVISAIEIPIAAVGIEHRLEVSLGIAEIDRSTNVAEEFMRRADVALYRAKEVHGSAHVLYDEAMDTERQESVRLEKDLRGALSAGAIVPNYQPIVDLRTGDILKFEALARWYDPARGEIPPAVFIPLAETRGLIAAITETILYRACADAISWPPAILLSVNLSAVLLADKSFILKLVKILSDTHFPASRLELEITEQALGADYEVVRPFLDDLRTLGIRIALDDFGTGYSSLSRLKQLPFDDIKIDRSFVQGLAGNPDRLHFVRTIMQLGRGLGMTVSAEGVEDPDQLHSLVSEGCTVGQGFLFSEAVPASSVAGLLRSASPFVDILGTSIKAPRLGLPVR